MNTAYRETYRSARREVADEVSLSSGSSLPRHDSTAEINPLRRELRRVLIRIIEHSPFLLWAGAYGAIATLLLGPRPAGLSPWGAELWEMLPVALLVAIVVHLARIVLQPGGARLALRAETAVSLIRKASPERVVGGLLAMWLHAAILPTFSYFKHSLPKLHPFSFDKLFANVDRFLHFGVDPWVLTSWVPEAVTVLTDEAYYLVWASSHLFVFAWLAWSPSSPRRTQYLAALALVWTLLGTLLAVALSSAGPIFYDRVTGGTTFLPLLERLATIHETSPLRTLEIREYLWTAYVTDEPIEFSGISAMPSLHVASALLTFLAARTISPLAGWLTAASFAAVLFGSVHLGWHYAIDAYVSIAAVILLWHLSGRYARWLHDILDRMSKA